MRKETFNSGTAGEANIQVVLSTHNSEKYLSRCFDSVEKSLRGHKWIFTLGDDGSSDNTLRIASEYSRRSSADYWNIKKFPKAKNVAQAKNRVLRMAKDYGKRYPIICFMDSDDEMLAERISFLLPEYRARESKFIVGDYIIEHYKGYTEYINVNEVNVRDHLRFGIWATLFDESIIPENSQFFDENLEVYSDFLKWWKLRHEDDMSFDFLSGRPVHVFHRRKDSISGETLKENLNKIKEEKDRIYKLV